MHYQDMIIEATDAHVERTADKNRIGRFKVRVLASPAGEMSAAQAIPVEYDDKTLQRQLSALEQYGLHRFAIPQDRHLISERQPGDPEQHGFDQASLIELGRILGLLLLPPGNAHAPAAVRTLFIASLGKLAPEEGLRLRLQLPPALAAMPWEYVYLDRAGDGDSVAGFLALDPKLAIVRHEALPLPAPLPLLQGEVKVVAAFASPPQLPPLNVQKEQADLRAALQAYDSLKPTYLSDATLDEVTAAIDSAEIFHFAGHGISCQQPTDQPDVLRSTGSLALDDQEVDAEQLGINLRSNGVRLVVLGACETARRDGLNGWSGVASALVRSEIPVVVGNQYSIRDSSAIAFSRAFYRALVAGRPIERAVTDGRLAVYNADKAGRDWGVAVLYMRAANGELFGGATNQVERTVATQQAEAAVELRVKEVAAGGEVLGAEVRKMLAGKLGVNVVIEGTVYGKVVGLVLDTFGGGSAVVKETVDTVGAGGSLTGVKIDKLG